MAENILQFTNTTETFLDTLARLRLTVGYLGEREQFGWWQSSFFTTGASAFLSPLFPRTLALATCNGVTQAAALVHDERIGTGHVYHLFRLPEDIEQGLHHALQDSAAGLALLQTVPNRETALNGLRRLADNKTVSGIAAVRVGNISSVHDLKAWRTVAGMYLHAFEHATPIFPYFRDAA